MHERQTLGYKSIRDLRDFDSDGLMDLSGQTFTSLGTILYAALTDSQHTKEVLPGAAGALYRVTNRYFGDIDGDGLNDDLSSDGPNSVRIVYGDRIHPLIGPSYVDIYDNTNQWYPDLERTYVAAVGMLGGRPCVVQMYPRWPGFYTYELVELNLEDLRQRKPRIRTNLLAKIEQPGAAYGLVVLRTPNVWWLFDTNNDDNTKGRGMKVTSTSITLEPVSDFWRGGWQQYFGQGGKSVDENFPRVMDGDRPFIREGYKVSEVENGESVRHAVFALARLVDAEFATVEIIGSGYPHKSQYHEAYATNAVVVPDVDNDTFDDFMVTMWYRDTESQKYQSAVSLYLTSQRPIVSVKEPPPTTEVSVIDQGESWRIVDGVQCFETSSTSARIYDINGSAVATVTVTCSGADVVIDKPRALSPQALWLRLGACTVRLQ